MGSSPLPFDWDDANVTHLRRHSVLAHEAEECYWNDLLVIEEQFAGGEARYLALGETNAGRWLAIVFTVRSGSIRFITAYPMTKQQQEIFDEG